MWVGVMFMVAGALAATQCPCTFTVDPLANSALTTYVYPVIECDQICGPPALAYQYYSFESPQGPCRCFSSDTDLIGYYYENSSSLTDVYYQNGGTAAICDPCFPSPTPSVTPSLSPSESASSSPSTSPSGMCYVVNNLLYGKVYTDGYYTVVHGINASHAYNPAPILLGRNPSCTESPGVCVCSYTQGSTFSCPYTRSVTLNYQYGATTTMTFVTESPVCRYTFNMFINFNSVSPTPSTSSSFTPAGSPTVSKTQSVTVSPSVTQSVSLSSSVTQSVSLSSTISESLSSSPSLTSSTTVSPSQTPSITGEAAPQPVIKRNTILAAALDTTQPPSPSKSSNDVAGIVLGTLALTGMIGLGVSQFVRSRNTQPPAQTQPIDDEDDDDDFVETPVVPYIPSPEMVAPETVDDDDRKRKGTTLLQLDTEDVGAVMMFLRMRMKTATVVDSYL